MDNKKKRPPQKRTAEQKRRDTMQAYAVLIVLGVAVVGLLIYLLLGRTKTEPEVESRAPETVTMQNSSAAEVPESEPADDSSQSTPASADKQTADSSKTPEAESSAPDEPKSEFTDGKDHKLEVIDGITYVDGIMIVNKTYNLPEDYAPGLDPEAEAAFYQMAGDAWSDGISLFICSGFRSYREQDMLYSQYAYERGSDEADKVSSRPGHSEHQSGLCMDINTTEFDFAGTDEAVWLANHCADYGFIIRFPLGKEDITGYAYEPWHIRYVGVKAAQEIFEQDICLEEYLGVTSDYRYSTDQS